MNRHAITERLDDDSQRQLGERLAVGEAILGITWPSGLSVDPDDRETCASDAVSDVLTAVFGPYGAFGLTRDGGGRLEMADRMTPEQLNEVRSFLERALDSWRGEAEDYTVQDTNPLEAHGASRGA